MVTITIEGYVTGSTDTTNRYMTITLQPIDYDWTEWPHRIVLNRGSTGLIYSRQENVNPGTYPVYLGITVMMGYWDVRVVIKVTGTGQTIFDETVRVENFPIRVGDVTVGEGPSVSGDGLGVNITKLMNDMMRVMMPMLGMMMMVQMMTGLVQGFDRVI